MKRPAVYIVTNRPKGTLYIGVTSNLVRRIHQHKTHAIEGFTRKYGTDKLVYFELFDDMETAIRREKQLKKWRRSWKIALIEKENPKWNDLYEKLL